MGDALCTIIHRASCLDGITLIAATMIELFIELTNQIFWPGYAQDLATADPALFQFEYNEFLNAYEMV
jgi:hypothetical protein